MFELKKVVCFFCIALVSIAIICIGVFNYIVMSDDYDVKQILVEQGITNVYDKDSKKISEFHGGDINEYVKIKDIPKSMQDAIISIEDERFMSHNGVDIKRTVGATLRYIFSLGKVDYGGSTITQQLIKNKSKDDEKTPIRKIREMGHAFKLEKLMSKEEILEQYLNTIYYGNGIYGIANASKVYFNKPLSKITLSESAFLAGIVQSPGGYDPYEKETSAKGIARKDVVLGKMFELGKISKNDYDNSKAVAINFSNGYSKNRNNFFYINAAMKEASQILKSLNKDSDVYNGRYRIYTNCDSSLQSKAEKVITGNEYNLGKGLQAAMVVMTPDGKIVTLIGGRDNYEYNRAILPRQPGSAIKPLVAYGPGFDKGKFTKNTIFSDKQIQYGNWSPKNWYSGYKGDMTVKNAIAMSTNTVAVQALETVGIGTGISYLKNLGITSVSESDKNLSLALGGMTNGISPLELAGAYNSFLNEGTYIKPYFIEKITTSDGKVIYNAKVEKRNVFKPETAKDMLECLYGVVNSSVATASGAKLNNMQVAGKTGTTSDDKDTWFVGITPYYTSSIWLGYDVPKSVPNGAVKLSIWKAIMGDAHKKLAPANLFDYDIEKNEDLVQEESVSAEGETSSEIVVNPQATPNLEVKPTSSPQVTNGASGTEQKSKQENINNKPEVTKVPEETPKVTKEPEKKVYPVYMGE